MSPPDDAESRVEFSAVGLPEEVAEILRRQGISALYPPQAAALGPALAGRSVVLACPTASGKSLVAYLSLLRAARSGRTGLYLVPLRALAQEKFDELEAFGPLGVRTGISIGDFDLSNAELEKVDILVATSEKADGLLRRGSPWLSRLGVVVADEVHLIRDPGRGPTLEVTLTRLRREHADLQVVALSATVGNSAEVADWLGADHVASDFRPVPLRRGVYFDGRLQFTDGTSRELGGPGEPVPRLVRSVIQEGGQALVFTSTRRGSEQAAQSLATTVRGLLTRAEREATRAVADALQATGEEETEGLRRLAALVPNGVAFHNASLTNPERRLIERAFRDRVLKALTATPTLAAGINLPARRVIVRDLTRYDDRIGMPAPIPAGEVHQMLGRAGRPRFDASGEAVLLARSADEVERLERELLRAPPEDVESRLAAEPALRMHLLALIASGAVRREEELEGFFRATFYGHTLPLDALVDKVAAVRRFLADNELLAPGRELAATRFGHLTSELYLDPMSALVLRQALERTPRGVDAFPLLAAVAATPDLPPMFLRRDDERLLLERFTEEEPALLVKPEEPPVELDFEVFLATLKTATVLERWTSELPIVEITSQAGIGAGDLRSKVEDAEWLLYGMARLALLFQRSASRRLDDMALRVRYGVRDELLDLVRLRGIGRVRGRRLFEAGFTDQEALKGATAGRLESLLGSSKLAESVLKQVHRGRRAPAGTAPPMAPATVPRPRKTPRQIEDFGPE